MPLPGKCWGGSRACGDSFYTAPRQASLKSHNFPGSNFSQRCRNQTLSQSCVDSGIISRSDLLQKARSSALSLKVSDQPVGLPYSLGGSQELLCTKKHSSRVPRGQALPLQGIQYSVTASGRTRYSSVALPCRRRCSKQIICSD